MSGYADGAWVWVRYAAVRDDDGTLVELRVCDDVPREQWLWLRGEVVGECPVFRHCCTDDGLVLADDVCSCREWTVDVLEEGLLRWQDDDVAVYPVVFRDASELMPRSVR